MVLDLIWKELLHFLLINNIFGVDMSSSVHEDILILGGGPTKGLDDTTMTAEKSIQSILLSMIKSLSLHHNGSNIYLIVNGKFINLKQKTLKLMQVY